MPRLLMEPYGSSKCQRRVNKHWSSWMIPEGKSAIILIPIIHGSTISGMLSTYEVKDTKLGCRSVVLVHFFWLLSALEKPWIFWTNEAHPLRNDQRTMNILNVGTNSLRIPQEKWDLLPTPGKTITKMVLQKNWDWCPITHNQMGVSWNRGTPIWMVYFI